MLISRFEAACAHYDDMPTLSVPDFVIMGILSQWPRAVQSMGQITVMALRPPTVSGKESLWSTDGTHRQGSHVSSFILEWFACLWHILRYIIHNFVISTRKLVLHCSPGNNQSVY